MSAIVEDVSITSAAEEVVGEVVGEGDAGTGDSQDRESTPVPSEPKKKATPRKKAEPKVDADGSPLPKTPRKVATPKLDAEGNPIAKTPRKSSVKKPAVKAVKTEDGEEGTENGVSMAAEDDGEEFATPVTPASKKRVKKVSSDETPSKRIKGNEIPSCKANLSEQDRMLMEWKESGKGWKEIGLEWNRITGKPVGSSTLPNRYARLKAALVELKEGDMERLLFAKDIIASDLEQEMVEFQKKQEQEAESHKRRQDAELWVRISSRITKMGADTYTGTAIQKAFQKEKNDGFPHRETEFFKELTESGYAISDDEAAGGVTDEIRADSQDTAEELPAPATPKVAPKATPKSKKGNRRMVSFADPAGVPLPDVADTPVKVEVHSEAEAEEELTAEQMEVVQEGIDEVKSLFA